MLLPLYSSLLLSVGLCNAYALLPRFPNTTLSSTISSTITPFLPVPGQSTATVSTASPSSISTIAGVTSNTVITTTDSSGNPTAVPVLTGCDGCGPGDIILWGVPLIPGVYLIPGIAGPVTIGSDLVPTEGPSDSNPDSASQTQTQSQSQSQSQSQTTTTTTSSCASTITVTDYFVSCDAEGSSSSCATTSSSLSSGCDATPTTSITTESAVCSNSPISPDDDQGDDGGTFVVPSHPAPTTPTLTLTPDPAPQPQPTPTPVTCQQDCECAEPIPNRAPHCQCWCVCSDHTRHPFGQGCDNISKIKRGEAVYLSNEVKPRDLDDFVKPAVAVRIIKDGELAEPSEPETPLKATKQEDIHFGYSDDRPFEFRDASGAVVTVDQRMSELRPRDLSFDDAVCKGRSMLQAATNGVATSQYTTTSQLGDEWTDEAYSEPDTVIDVLDNDAARALIGSDDFLRTQCTYVLARWSGADTRFGNIFCKDGTLIAEMNYRNGAPVAWSDVVWVNAQIQGVPINKVWRYEVATPDTRGIMDTVLPGSGQTSFSTTDENGLALLGTAHGKGVGWIVAQHKDHYSGQTITGGTVFKDGGFYMLGFNIG